MTRVEHWLACPRKSCCSYYDVVVTGDEVVRLARTLAVTPWSFISYVEAAPGSGFALDRTPARFELVLDRRSVVHEDELRCTFLLELADGTRRCGLGAARPRTCFTYPLLREDGGFGSDSGGCSCDWSGVVIADEAGIRTLDEDDAARVRYADVVELWNDYVAGAEPGEHGLRDFLRYLMDVYG